mgnify:CR=1 FL=1
MASRPNVGSLRGLLSVVVILMAAIIPGLALAGSSATLSMDARTGEVFQESNADTPLHPASLTKMMTLYIAFQAIERGEITADTVVKVTSAAAAEPPSKLGLRTGQEIRMRYLIRAAAVKSANDAATAIGIALEGSEAAFARRMNRMAASMGMTRSSFRNANGLTETGHMSTARDMAILGRHLIYDFPEYYHIFSRRTIDAGMAQVNNTNRRFLDAYQGADGIKTGFTNAAGYNLVASAERGSVRIIAVVMGGTSTPNRNAKAAELLDIGFARAPRSARINRLALPRYEPGNGNEPDVSVAVGTTSGEIPAAGRTIRVTGAVISSPRPPMRSGSSEAMTIVVADADAVSQAVADAMTVAAESTEEPEDEAVEVAVAEVTTATVTFAAPPVRPETLTQSAVVIAEVAPETALVEAAETVVAEIVVAEAEQATPEPVQEQIIVASASAAVAAPTAVPVVDTDVLDAAVAQATATAVVAPAVAEPQIVTRVSTSGGRHWGVNIGSFNSRYEAERVQVRVALSEMSSLDGTRRTIVESSKGFDANFMGMTREAAELACRRLQARGQTCFMIGQEG